MARPPGSWPAVCHHRGIPAPLDEHDLTLRRAIFDSFAATGEPGEYDGLASLAEQHVVVLDDDGRIVMAHPFAAPGGDAHVRSGGREWWGSCAWDAFGIVHALGLRDATVSAQGITVRVDDGAVSGDAVFDVLVPARHWWDDIAYT